MRVVGSRTRRIDWDEVTAGASAYTDDLPFPDALIARFLRSPHPHAQIRTLDVSRALRAPGVASVVTAADLREGLRYHHHGGDLADRPPLARDKVRYVGEEIAAVAAETREQAEAALRLIDVRYRRLRSNLTTTESRRKRATVIHDHRPDNVAVRVRRRWGKPASAPIEISGRYSSGRQSHASMETNRTIAKWDAEAARLDIWTSTQVPYFIQKEVSEALGLDRGQVSVREVAVGGGFGSKSKISEHEVLVAALALKTPGRPVAVVFTREDEFAYTKPRHHFAVDIRMGVDTDGRLLTQDAFITVDNGAYNHYGPSVTSFACSIMGSLYPVARAHIDADLIYTNTVPGGQFRGYGAPQATFAVECLVDEVADRLGIDPIDLRVRNAHESGNVTHAGWELVNAHVKECLTEARRLIDWDARRTASGRGSGVGVAIAMHPSGSHAYEGANRSEAGISIGIDGRVTVRFGGADPGTGQRTLLAQAAAEELGLDPNDIDVKMMDSDDTPFDMGSWSSRGTFMGVSATRDAARSACDELISAAADKAGVNPSEVRMADGHAYAGNDSYEFGDLAALLGGTDGLSVESEFISNTSLVTPDGIANISPTYSFAAHAVAVEVDESTGKVDVVDVVAVHDSGVAINPIDTEGQVTGGVAMALGAALGEEVVYEQGKMVGPGYVDYALPRAADLPQIRVSLIEYPDPLGPYGAKGIGEAAINPTAAAVANAVANAIGVRIRDLPITPDKVLSALAQRDNRQRRWRRVRKPSAWWNAFVRWTYPRGLFRLLHGFGTKFARRRDVRPITAVERPLTVGDAIELANSEGSVPTGGATDFLVTRRLGLDDRHVVVSLRKVGETRGIEALDNGHLRIGASATLADLARHPAVPDVLRQTTMLIASPQLRQTATVGGNLCQQKRCWFYRSGFDCFKSGGWTCPCYAVMGDHRYYHAAMNAHRCQAVTPSDLATTLLALDGVVQVHSQTGGRYIPVGEFYEGPGEPALARGEIVIAVEIPLQEDRAGAYDKLTRWHGDFAMVSVAASAIVQGSRLHDVRVVVGALAPTPVRLHSVERSIDGVSLTADVIDRASTAWLTQVDPLPGNEWKIDAAYGMIKGVLEKLAGVGG